MKKRPNFVYIITDQHRFDWLGLTGHPLVKTPNIDSLAKRGTVFDRFYVANPVCMPNRAALLTGRYSSVNSVRCNGIPLSKDANTFTKRLMDEGYDTAALGKMHLQTMTLSASSDATREFENPELEAKAYYRGKGYIGESPDNWQPDSDYTLDLPYYGFGEVDLVTQHGVGSNGHYGHWLRNQRDDAESLRDPKNQLPHDYTCPQAVRTALPEDLYHTSYIGKSAVTYLKDPARQEKPFFAFVSFPDPHHPFNPPGKYWDMYDPDDFEVPANFDSDQQTKLVRWLKEKQGTLRHVHMGPNPVTRREVQEAMALTAGMIAMVDDAIGEILAALKETGLESNTIVAFNSDHGELMGDHGLLFKGPMHYDPVIHVPMIWFDPRVTQVAHCTGFASTIDVAPTILATAGILPYHGIQGNDLTKALIGGSTGRDAILVEDEYHSPLCYSKPPRVRTVRTDRYRLSVVIGEDGGELYDFQSDPHEMVNRFEDPEYRLVKADLAMTLVHLMGHAVDHSPRRLTQA